MCLEAAYSADLTDEVDILSVLRFLTLSALVLPTEVEETARQHKVAAVVGGSMQRREHGKITISGNSSNNISSTENIWFLYFKPQLCAEAGKTRHCKSVLFLFVLV